MATENCPDCGAPVPELPGYPEWCDSCGWNLEPPAGPEPEAGRFARIAEALGRRLLADADGPRPRWTSARALAFVVAAIVHLFTLALFAGGVAAIVVEFPNVISMLVGLVMVSAAFLMRPRVAGEPDGIVLEPEQAPRLHALVTQVTRPAPDRIVVDDAWNAAWVLAGWRRRRVLVLGLPLFAALEPPERVALIAHEAAHGRNGDARHGRFVGSAISGLDALSEVLRPAHGSAVLAVVGFSAVEWLTNGLTWLLSRPVDAVLWLQARLLLHDMRRAEFLADDAAAQVAGTDAVIALHERLLLYPAFAHAVQQAAVRGGDDVLDQIRTAVRAVPERERERRRRIARLEHVRLDDTHPPTAMRISVLEQRERRSAAVTLDAFGSERIDAELEPLDAAIGRELVDGYRGALYSG
jgi:Zn-dependent protease with chaperone function